MADETKGRIEAKPGSKLAAVMEARRRVVDEAEGLLAEDGTVPEESEARYAELTARASKMAEQRDQLAEMYADTAAGSRVVTSWNGSGEETERKADGSFHVKEHAEDKPWGSLGEQLAAIAFASMPHGAHDPRLGSPRAATGGGNTTDPNAGGFLVQEEYSTALFKSAMEVAVLAPLCTPIPIGAGADSIKLPYVKNESRATGSRFGGVQVFWRKEAGTVTHTRPEIDELTIELEELMGLAHATDRMLRNARMMEALFSSSFRSEFAFKVDDGIVRGTGAGQMLGILPATDVTVTEAKETGQAADTIVHKNISKMYAHIPSQLRSQAVWLAQEAEVGAELDGLFIPAGTGALEPRVVSYGPDGVVRVKGKSLLDVEQCEALGTKGDLICAVMSEYLLLTQGGIEEAQSMHVRFETAEQTFRWMYRVNGRPAWANSVTPYKGSVTRSPFVVLADR